LDLGGRFRLVLLGRLQASHTNTPVKFSGKAADIMLKYYHEEIKKELTNI
jgi:hypothetical protein